MTDKKATGNIGEVEAAEFLKQKGYEIVERNYRFKHSEIDLIVRINNLIVFVEVKTRTSIDFGEPEAFVDSKKAAKIFEGADHYVYENNWTGNIRFDIISVKLGKRKELVHFEDAIQ